MDVNMSILVIISCICIFFVIGKIFIVPIKWITKVILNSILGGVLIWIINLIGGIWSFHIGLNLWTSILVGILGVPGALLLILIRLMVRNLKLKIYWVNFKIKKARGNNLILPLVVPLACEDGAAVKLRFIKYSLRIDGLPIHTVEVDDFLNLLASFARDEDIIFSMENLQKPPLELPLILEVASVEAKQRNELFVEGFEVSDNEVRGVFLQLDADGLLWFEYVNHEITSSYIIRYLYYTTKFDKMQDLYHFCEISICEFLTF